MKSVLCHDVKSFLSRWQSSRKPLMTVSLQLAVLLTAASAAISSHSGPLHLCSQQLPGTPSNGGSFPSVGSNCFCWPFCGILPFRTISSNSEHLHTKFSVELSALSKRFYGELFIEWELAVASHVVTTGAVSSGCVVTFLLLFCSRPPGKVQTRQGGSTLMELRAPTLIAGSPVIQGWRYLFLTAQSQQVAYSLESSVSSPIKWGDKFSYLIGCFEN